MTQHSPAALEIQQEASSAVSPPNPVASYAQEVAALTRRWFLNLRRERLSLLFGLAQPAIWLVFFGGMFRRAIDPEVTGTPDYTSFFLAGIIVFTVLGNSVGGAIPLLFDRENGFLMKLMTAPISRSSLIVSRFLFQTVMGSAQALVIVAVGLALGVEVASGPAGVLVILVAAGLLGMALASAFLSLAYTLRSHADFFAVTGFITLPLLFTSSAFVPVSAMPGWMQVVAHLNPLTYAINLVRGLVLDGWETSLLWDAAALSVFAAGCLLIGTLSFRRQAA